MYIAKSRLSILMGMANVKIQDIINDTGLARNTIKALKDNNFKDVSLKTILKLCEYFKNKDIECEISDLLQMEWIENKEEKS